MSRADTVGRSIDRLEEGEFIRIRTVDGGCTFAMGNKGLVLTHAHRSRNVMGIRGVGEYLLAVDLAGTATKGGYTILIPVIGAVGRYHLDGDGGEILDEEILPGILAR